MNQFVCSHNLTYKSPKSARQTWNCHACEKVFCFFFVSFAGEPRYELCESVNRSRRPSLLLPAVTPISFVRFVDVLPTTMPTGSNAIRSNSHQTTVRVREFALRVLSKRYYPSGVSERSLRDGETEETSAMRKAIENGFREAGTTNEPRRKSRRNGSCP